VNTNVRDGSDTDKVGRAILFDAGFPVWHGRVGRGQAKRGNEGKDLGEWGDSQKTEWVIQKRIRGAGSKIRISLKGAPGAGSTAFGLPGISRP